MTKFCEACGKSLENYEDGITLCVVCNEEFENITVEVDEEYTTYYCYLLFCTRKKLEQTKDILSRVLDEKANLFMENLRLKEEIRTFKTDYAEDIKKNIEDKLMGQIESLKSAYEELHQRTLGLVIYGGPKSHG